MKLEQLRTKLKTFKRDFGKIGSMASVTTVMPSVGSMFLLLVVYEISPWLQNNNQIGVVLYILFLTVFAGLALVATNILGVVSGFAFGLPIGIFAQMSGLAGAAIVMFFLAKRYARKDLEQKIGEKPKLRAVHSALLNENFLNTLAIIILIRLSPAMPFAVTNFMLSAAGVSLGTFLLGTSLGMLPRSLAIVFVGSSLSELNFSQPQESWAMILGIVATILAVTVIGIISKRALNRLTPEQEV